MSGAVEILDAGVGTTIQDRGRPGYAHLGVSASGVVDPGLAATVNRLVGNPGDLAVLETCGNLVVRAVTAVLVASSTAPAPVSLRPGDVCTIRPDGRRAWHYLALRGGIDVEPVLGSRSTDTLSGLGPPPPAAGDLLPVGDEPRNPVVADVAPLPIPVDVARATPGPRADWFADGWERLVGETNWTVTVASRIGVRLRGVRLERRVEAELPSEGLVRGAIQVPPDGDPVMMLADHPTTGGYPVIAVVDPDDVAIVAQRLGGSTLRIRV